MYNYIKVIKLKIIVSAGGTGGHIYPALAIIKKFQEKEKDLEVLYIGTHDRMEKDIVPNMGIKYEAITTASSCAAGACGFYPSRQARGNRGRPQAAPAPP